MDSCGNVVPAGPHHNYGLLCQVVMKSDLYEIEGSCIVPNATSTKTQTPIQINTTGLSPGSYFVFVYTDDVKLFNVIDLEIIEKGLFFFVFFCCYFFFDFLCFLFQLIFFNFLLYLFFVFNLFFNHFYVLIIFIFIILIIYILLFYLIFYIFYYFYYLLFIILIQLILSN